MFELLHGYTPFANRNLESMYDSIMGKGESDLKFNNKEISFEAKDLISKCLIRDQTLRIGHDNTEDIK